MGRQRSTSKSKTVDASDPYGNHKPSIGDIFLNEGGIGEGVPHAESQPGSGSATNKPT